MDIRFASISAIAALIAVPALAQPIVPVSQVRSVSGQSDFTDASGTVTFGPVSMEAPAGHFGSWLGDMVVPGVITGPVAQEGGLLAEDRIQINRFSMSMGGGNGPFTSGSGSMRNEFTYTFTVAEGTTFMFNSNIGCAGPGSMPGTTNVWSVEASLSSGSGDVFRFATAPENNYNLLVMDYPGTLSGGTYTLSVVATGAVTFDGGETGAGAGGGAGGAEPAMSFVVVAPEPSCPADLGVAGGEPGHDGALDNNDFIAFINYFFELAPQADVGVAGGEAGSDSQWDNNDFIAFINLFFQGC